MLQNEVNQKENSALINDLLDASDARQYTLFRRAISRMAQILYPDPYTENPVA
jgi:hypothetical protein